MTERFFEDFNVGDRFESRGATLSEAQILDFAQLYDPQPFHIDRPAAEVGPYGGIIASGFQTLALTFRLFYDTGVIKYSGMGSPGFDKLRWLRPVRPGDTLRVRAEVLETRPSASKTDRGYMQIAYETRNQNDEVVMTCTASHICARR